MIPKDKKLLAQSVKKLTQDETFRFIIDGIKEDQVKVFLNPTSSDEARANAHVIVRGVAEVENAIDRILKDEVVFDKKHR